MCLWLSGPDIMPIVKSLALHNLKHNGKSETAVVLAKCMNVHLRFWPCPHGMWWWNVSFLGWTHLQCFAGKSHLWESGQASDKCSDRRLLNTRLSLDCCHLDSLYLPFYLSLYCICARCSNCSSNSKMQVLWHVNREVRCLWKVTLTSDVKDRFGLDPNILHW